MKMANEFAFSFQAVASCAWLLESNIFNLEDFATQAGEVRGREMKSLIRNLIVRALIVSFRVSCLCLFSVNDRL